MPRFLRRERWSLKPPFHPYPHLSARAVFSLWHCLSAMTYVVTSRVYLRLDRSYVAPRPMEFGLSSRDCRRERPSALPRRGDGGGWNRVWRVGNSWRAHPNLSEGSPGAGWCEQNRVDPRQEWLLSGPRSESHLFWQLCSAIDNLAHTHNKKRTQVMKTLKLSVILALASAVFGAAALSAAHSPRGASNESSKSAKGHCDSKGSSCCKKDCKK